MHMLNRFTNEYNVFNYSINQPVPKVYALR